MAVSSDDEEACVPSQDGIDVEEYVPGEEDSDEEECHTSDSDDEGPGVKKVCNPCPMFPCVRSSRKSVTVYSPVWLGGCRGNDACLLSRTEARRRPTSRNARDDTHLRRRRRARNAVSVRRYALRPQHTSPAVSDLPV